jgi:glucose-6-phosphate 1-epimerase
MLQILVCALFPATSTRVAASGASAARPVADHRSEAPRPRLVARSTWQRPVAAGSLGLYALFAAGLAQAQDAPVSDLSTCITALKRGAAEAGVRADTYERLTRGVQDFRPQIDRLTQSQPEFELRMWDYITRRVDPERVADGRQLLVEESDSLARIAARHGVDGATVVAVYGIETDFGRVQGRYPVVDATLSRACLRLGSDERRAQFHAALWLVQEGHVKVEDFTGSWAGAFGKTQFMPGTFRAYMADGDDSGTVDIIHNTADALATTARYLKALRWREGLPWGIEVRAEARLLASAAVDRGNQPCLSGAGGGACRSLAQWQAAGVGRAEGGGLFDAGAAAMPRDAPAALFAPTGPEGPVWLITQNYRAIWQYNRADAYALAIGLLSDQLRGRPGPRTPWPTDDPGVSRAEFREIQALLRQRGACDVTADGRDGPRTSAAIRAVEAARGLPETGRGGTKVLALLREEAARRGAAPAAAAGSAPDGAAAAACDAAPR